MVYYIIFFLYNLLSIAVILWILLFLNTYINGFILPNFLKTDFTIEMVCRFLIANLEGGVFAFLLYVLNKWYLLDVVKLKSKSIAYWTAWGTIFIIILLTGIAYYAIYKKEQL